MVSDVFLDAYLQNLNDQNLDLLNESVNNALLGAAILGGTLFGTMNDLQARSNTKQSMTKIMDSIKFSEAEEFVAKVLYSETSNIATLDEIIAIGCVIQNRIHNKAFRNLSDAYEVCKQPKAFSCVNSSKNVNWSEFTPTLNKRTLYDCKLAKILLDPKLSLNGFDWTKDIVYYHDKSISMPEGWNNKYWTAILVKETPHFKFYKIEPAKQKIQLASSKQIKSKRSIASTKTRKSVNKKIKGSKKV